MQDDGNEPTFKPWSRRQLIGGLGAGLAVSAFGTPAFALEQKETGKPQPLIDPAQKFPKPPFKSQSQPWPALASKMQPPPDHGEKSYRGSGRLLGRKALITGGDSGMGRAAAIAFAREGADVVINYLPAEQSDADDVLALIKADGRKGVGIPGDLRGEDFCKQLVGKAAEALGGLDILVNNAARQQTNASILDITSEQFDWTMKTNIYAPFWVTKAALPHLKPGSVILVTTSEQAMNPSAELFDYAQTKAANSNFVRCLAKQLAPKGIRVNGIAPGPVWTPLQVAGGATQEKLKSFGSNTLLKRPGQPAELAGIYVLLASSDLSFTTGQIFGATGAANPN